MIAQYKLVVLQNANGELYVELPEDLNEIYEDNNALQAYVKRTCVVGDLLDFIHNEDNTFVVGKSDDSSTEA